MTTHDRLCATLRTLDTATMTTPELAEACLAAVPEATPPDIVAALRAVAAEELREVDQLELYARTAEPAYPRGRDWRLSRRR